MAIKFLSLCAASVLTVSVQNGLGQHQGNLLPSATTTALMYQWIFQPFIVLSSVFSRISISIMLIHIFPRKKAMKWFLIILAIANSTFAIIGLTLIFTQCSPPQKLWNPEISGTCLSPVVQMSVAITKAGILVLTFLHCPDTDAGYLIVMNAASDIATGAWPAVIVRKLQMKRSKKIFIGGIFGLTLL